MLAAWEGVLFPFRVKADQGCEAVQNRHQTEHLSLVCRGKQLLASSHAGFGVWQVIESSVVHGFHLTVPGQAEFSS